MMGRPLIPRTTPTEKRCVHCATVKVHAQFNRSAKSPDGLMSWCRACCQAYAGVRREDRRVQRLEARIA